MEVLGVGIVVHHGDLHGDVLLLPFHVDHFLDQRCTGAVEVFHEFHQPLLAVEGIGDKAAVLVGVALIGEGELDALVQEGQFPQACGQGVVVELADLENAGVRVEGDDGPSFVGGTGLLNGVLRLARAVFLLVDLAVAMDLREQHVAQRVHAGYAHTVEAAGDLVAVLVEFATGVKHGHDHFQGGAALLGVDGHGDATTVVLHPDTVVGQDVHIDRIAMPGKGLVDGVVHHLVHQMVQALHADVADVHGRAFPYRLKALQHLDAVRSVAGGRFLFRFAHFHCLCHFRLDLPPVF